MCGGIQIPIHNALPLMTAVKGQPLLRNLLGGSAKMDSVIAPGLAGAAQGSQDGPRDRPRLGRGCAGEQPYRCRTEGAELFIPVG